MIFGERNLDLFRVVTAESRDSNPQAKYRYSTWYNLAESICQPDSFDGASDWSYAIQIGAANQSETHSGAVPVR